MFLNDTATLEEVRAAFCQHRECSPPRQRIPDHLRRQAIGLLVDYSRLQLRRALGITDDMLCTWERRMQPGATAPVAPASPSFITLPVAGAEVELPSDSDPSPPFMALPPLHLRLELPGGARVIIEGDRQGVSQQGLSLLQGLGYGRTVLPGEPT